MIEHRLRISSLHTEPSYYHYRTALTTPRTLLGYMDPDAKLRDFPLSAWPTPK